MQKVFLAFTTISEDPFRVKPKLHILFDLKDHRNLYEEGFYAKKFRGEQTYNWYKWLRNGEKFKNDDAVKTFQNSGIDHLWLGNKFISKRR